MAEEKARPSVSIVITAYNTGPYLRRCLGSVAAQTLRDWECVCVDNGSTDGGGAILDEFAAKDSRFVVIHKEYGEQGTGRNAGLEAARGEYVGFVDSDDWIEPETYEATLEAARRTGADIVQWRWVDETKSGPRPSKEMREGFFDPVASRDEYFSYFVWNKLFRRAFVQENGIRFYEGVILGDDAAFSVASYPLAAKCFFLNRPLYHYDKTREGSITKTVTVDSLLGEAMGYKNAFNLIEERRGDWHDIGEEYTLFFKLRAKGFFVGRLFPPPDYRLFRSVFPEANSELLPRFLRLRTKQSLIQLLYAWRLEAVVKAIVWIKAKLRKLAGRG